MRKAPVGPYTYGTYAHTWRGGAHTAETVREWDGVVVELTLASDPERGIPELVYPNVFVRVSEVSDGRWVEVHQVLTIGTYATGVELAEVTAVRNIVAIRPAATREPVKRDYTAEDLSWLHTRTVSLVREVAPVSWPLPLSRRMYRRHVLSMPYEGAPEIRLDEIVNTYISTRGAQVNVLKSVGRVPIEDIVFVMEVR